MRKNLLISALGILFGSLIWQECYAQEEQPTFVCDSTLTVLADGTPESKNIYFRDESNGESGYDSFSWNQEKEEWIKYAYHKVISKDDKYYFEENLNYNDGKISGGNKFERFQEIYIVNGVRFREFITISYNWNIELNDWLGNSKVTYKYCLFENDSYEEMLEYLDLRWNEEKSDWYVNSSTINTFDNKGNLLTNERYESYNNKKTKEEYEYDDNGNCILYRNYELDLASKEWICYSKSIYEYDKDGNKTLEEYYKLNSSEEKWEIISKHEWFYDRSLLLAEIWTNLDPAGEITWGNKFEYTYTSQKQISVSTCYSYSSMQDSWELHHKEEYVYDVYGNNISIIYWFIPYEDLQSYTSMIAEYDAKGNKILQVNYQATSFDYYTQTFAVEPFYKAEYRYDDEHGCTLRAEYDFDSQAQNFVLKSKEEQLYDSKGNNTYNLWFGFDFGYLYEYEYNENNNVIGEYYSYYGSWTNYTWVKSGKRESEYDEHNNKFIDRNYSWNGGNYKWDLYSTTYYYYSIIESGLDEIRVDGKLLDSDLIYSLDGSKQSGLRKGLNIVTTSDGNVKKILVK